MLMGLLEFVIGVIVIGCVGIILFAPVLIAWARDLSKLSMWLIAAGILAFPLLGWFAGLYFAFAGSPEPDSR